MDSARSASSHPTSTTPQQLLGRLAAFAGTWAGSGSGHYPTIDDFDYDERIEFTAGPKPFLFYRSTTRNPTSGAPMHTETGYLRRCGDVAELLLAQPTGFVEIHRAGLDDGPALEFTAYELGRSPDAKPVKEVRRRIELLDDQTLVYDLWMAHDTVALTHHLHAELRRQPD